MAVRFVPRLLVRASGLTSKQLSQPHPLSHWGTGIYVALGLPLSLPHRLSFAFSRNNGPR